MVTFLSVKGSSCSGGPTNYDYNNEELEAQALRQADIVQKRVDRYLIDNNIKSKRKGASSLDVKAAKLRELGRMIRAFRISDYESNIKGITYYLCNL